MHERPADISDSDVAAALARQWALPVQDLSYLPVGFGRYHWLAADQRGSRWFVTVSDLGTPWVPDLRGGHPVGGLARNRSRARVRRRSRADEGWSGRRLSGQRHALTLFPFLDATAGRYGETGR